MGGKLAYIARARVQDVDDEYRKGILPYPILEGEQGGLAIAICTFETKLINSTTISAGRPWLQP